MGDRSERRTESQNLYGTLHLMFTRAKLARFFSEKTGLRVLLRLHRNKSNWLSFKKEEGTIFLSLHEHFLEGTDEVIEDVLSMLQGKRGLTAKSRSFLFAKENQPIEAASEPIGHFWNLSELYREVEKTYFADLNLKITWFGEMAKKRGRITLGQYDASCRLVKVHRLLDSDQIPKFFLHFIIYHEILHSIYSPKPHSKGFLSIHPKEFRVKEREFREYRQAQEWLKQNKQKLFFKRSYGWA